MDRASPATDYATLGEARVREYLDGAYARLYRQRLEQVAEAERAASGDGSVAREVARYLAVWMSYEDVIRVADLKSRASRFERVRHETGAQPGEIVRIQDHFRPGVAELADLLPLPLARRLLRWSQRRQAAGKGALSWPLKLEASSLHGFLGLRLLAACKGLRRRSARFAEEQALIERWLGAVRGVVPADRRWALELARCGRLVKGYGATNARGKANLVHILDHLANPAEAAGSDMAARVRAVCSAALEDDAGRRVDEVMGGFGVAPRPPQARPIRFLQRRVARQGGAA
jgi:indolepyruvate ferredoxin oxidoreductase beta subunit